MQTELPSGHPPPKKKSPDLSGQIQERAQKGLHSETHPINHMFGIENKFLMETMCPLVVGLPLQLARAH